MTKLAAVGKTLEDYNYENQMIADIILNEIADVQFMGMSVSLLGAIHKWRHTNLHFFIPLCHAQITV